MKTAIKIAILVAILSPNLFFTAPDSVGGQPCNNTSISGENCAPNGGSTAKDCEGQEYQKCFDNSAPENGGFTKDIYCVDGKLGTSCSFKCGSTKDAESEGCGS